MQSGFCYIMNKGEMRLRVKWGKAQVGKRRIRVELLLRKWVIRVKWGLKPDEGEMGSG